MKTLRASFFKQDAVTVAQKLLGKVIHYNGCSGMIVETEAYQNDTASHAFRRTKRSEIMYSSYAHWYIYFIYGMHHCLNITTNGTSQPGAVLIRALEPIEGIGIMKKRRNTEDPLNLCSGPGKICAAFAIDGSLNATKVNDSMHIYDSSAMKDAEIVSTSRIGIKNASELQWRFYVKGNRFVSRMKDF